MKRSVDAIRFSGAGLFFGAAAVLALFSAVLVYSYLRGAVQTADVWVVARDLPPGAALSDRDIQLRSMPAAAVPDKAVSDGRELLGQRVRYGLTAGDVLRSTHLVPDGSDMAHRLAEQGPQYRMIMLPGELVPAFQRLVPGDRLELTGVLPLQEADQNTTITVPLGMASVLDVPAAAGSNDRSMVLVALTDEQVPLVALTMRQGTLSVALVGANSVSEQAPPVRLDLLTQEAGGRVLAGSEPNQAVGPESNQTAGR